MKYDMLNKETIKRVIDTFDNHDDSINKKYASIKKKDNYWSSDRDRFVGRFFKKYIGKNFILMDKEIIAFNVLVGDHIRYWSCEPMSVYSNEYRKSGYSYQGEPIYRNSKKFLHISYIHAVNQMYGRGYIEMLCRDILERQFRYVLDINTLTHMQFKEITDDEFYRMADMFRDDRDEHAYKVTRCLSVDEMKTKKKSLCNGPIKETVIVMAKDSYEAYNKCTNAIEVEAC